MNCSIHTADEFIVRLKKLAKRYRSIKSDVITLKENLHENPFLGTDLGCGLRKVRMSIMSKGKGKSGGARVITVLCLIDEDNADLTLLTIYDKSDCANINKQELLEIMKKCGL